MNKLPGLASRVLGSRSVLPIATQYRFAGGFNSKFHFDRDYNPEVDLEPFYELDSRFKLKSSVITTKNIDKNRTKLKIFYFL